MRDHGADILLGENANFLNESLTLRDTVTRLKMKCAKCDCL